MPRYPLPPVWLGAVGSFCDGLMARVLQMDPQLHLEVVIKQSGLYTGLLDHFVDHAPEWGPEQGVAVFPDRPPPHVPTSDEVQGLDPRSFSESALPPAFVPELVFRIGSETGKTESLQGMRGHGALAVFLCRLSQTDLYERWKELAHKKVTDRLFRAMPIYAPLFSRSSFQLPSDFAAWLQPRELYIGESREDQAVVIAAGRNLDGVVTELARKLPLRLSHGEPEVLRW